MKLHELKAPQGATKAPKRKAAVPLPDRVRLPAEV